MVRYNFKNIKPVPKPEAMVDIVLSKTQKKTPTVIHPQYHISRIRAFYIRKVKFTQMTINDTLTQIVDDFPRLDDIHPFFGDLINILYNKDYYKTALGQVNSSRQKINKIGRDYVQFIKYGDSAYRCKRLKVACLGRMVSLLKRLNGLEYLERVRQHLSRLPQIDPSTRTLLLTGFPNVGKSSLINNITRAKVDVENYAFTTKSLFVGHFNHMNLQWQVIDTPGLLDRPLNSRNTIEMQSINALAHLFCCVLFLVDMSEETQSIEEQVKLFMSLKPLYRNKPVLIVGTKTDKKPMSKVEERKIKLIKSTNFPFVSISNQTKDGIDKMKKVACDMLLKNRVEYKLSSGSGKTSQNLLDRLYVSKPVRRDDKKREVVVPPSFFLSEGQRNERKENKELEIDRERKYGYGHYQMDQRKHYLLENEEERFDSIPEFMEGKNVLDFYHNPNLESKLHDLREEEDGLQRERDLKEEEEEEEEMDMEITDLFDEIEKKKKMYKMEHKEKYSNRPKLPRKYKKLTPGEMKADDLRSRGVDVGIIRNMTDRGRSTEIKKLKGRKMSRLRSKEGGNSMVSSKPRSLSQIRNLENILSPEAEQTRSGSILGKRNRVVGMFSPGERYETRALSASGKFGGIQDPRMQIRAVMMGVKKRKVAARRGDKIDSDKKWYDRKPKHLFTGKAGLKRDWR